MSEYLYELWTTQFSTLLELKLQQMGSLLRGKVREGFHVGKQASPVNQIAPISAKAPQGRFAPMGRIDAEFTRRWVFPQPRDIPQLIDSFDVLETTVDVQGAYAQNAAEAIGRAWDDAIISASFGTSYLGTDEGSMATELFSLTTYTTSTGGFTVQDSFGASAAVGMTVPKLVEAQRVLEHYHNDLMNDPPCLVIGSQQHADMLGQVEFVSREFNDRPVLVDGRIRRFMGFDIVISERLNVNATPDRECIVFVKSGLYLGIWKDMQTRVSIRNDLSSEPVQIYTNTMYGATRLQPGKVLCILCSDSTGADINP